MATIADLLLEYATSPKVVEYLKPFEPAWNEIRRVIFGMSLQVGTVLQRVAKSPPSPGYEPLLIERGVNPILARAMAKIIVRQRNRIERENKRLPDVIEAIRFLANHHRNRPAINRRVNVLLAASMETSAVETVFVNAGLHEGEFIQLLKSAAEGHEIGYRKLSEIAASLVPHLPNRRGPKVGAESAAHEFFLEHAVKLLGPSSFTWNPVEGKCTDPVTEATRREFGLTKFDPRPACRRLKVRQAQKN